MMGIGQLLQSLELIIPHEVVVGLVVVVVIVAFPGWLRNVRTRQIRAQVRVVARATTSDQRRAEEDRTVAMAKGDARLLLAVAEEAHRLNQLPLADRALRDCEATGAIAKDVAAYKRRIAPPVAGTDVHPLEVAVSVRRLLEEGLEAQARARLDDALRRFPNDPDLRALDVRLAEQASAR